MIVNKVVEKHYDGIGQELKIGDEGFIYFEIFLKAKILAFKKGNINEQLLQVELVDSKPKLYYPWRFCKTNCIDSPEMTFFLLKGKK